MVPAQKSSSRCTGQQLLLQQEEPSWLSGPWLSRFSRLKRPKSPTLAKISLNQAEGRAAWRKLSTWRGNMQLDVEWHGDTGEIFVWIKKQCKATEICMLEFPFLTRLEICSSGIIRGPHSVHLAKWPAASCTCHIDWKHLVIDIVRPRDLGWLGEVDHIKPTSCRRAWQDAGCVMMCAKSIKICQHLPALDPETCSSPGVNGWNGGCANSPAATPRQQANHFNRAWIVCSAQDDAGSGQNPCSSRV